MMPAPEAERGWLRRHGIVPRKRLGQTFLVHPEVASMLVRAMAPPAGVPILEIGAGAGALTRALLETGSRVWAFEVDPRLVALLRERFAGALRDGQLHLCAQSILAADLAELPDLPSEPLFLAGNLPYAFTTPILLWAAGQRRFLSGGAVLIQKEVADRITAAPGSRTYGSITVWIAYHAHVERVVTVQPGSFWPVPQVDSTLITIRFHPAPPVDIPNPDCLQRVLAAAFGQRRKMLRSSLGAALGGPEQGERLLSRVGIDPRRRAETLSLEEFARLACAVREATR